MEKTKKVLSVVLTLVLMLTGLPMYGMEVKASERLGAYNYEVNEDGDSVTITFCGENGDVTIPSEIDGKKVTCIGSGTFNDCKNITSVTISENVKNIEYQAFYNCYNLTSITLSDSVTDIASGAFWFCSDLSSIKVGANNKSYDSRDNCNAIIEKEGNKLILGCKNTIIPSNIESVASGAFSGCIGLENVIIPDGVTNIEGVAFSGCSNLKSIILPDSLKSIGMGIFFNCSSLENIVLPNGITTIEMNAFYRCSSLTGINIPSSVTSIESSAFWGCSSLAEISIPSSVTSIGNYAFYRCSSLTEISIPSSVTSIGDDAFSSCGESFVIYGYSGSVAETYANENGYEFVSIGKVTEDISTAEVTLEKNNYTYDGQAKTPSVTVKLGEKTLILDTDYTVAYSNNTNVGTATVTVTGKGNYTGSKTANFTISKSGGTEDPSKADISKAAVTLAKTSYTYDGKAKTPSVTVKLDGKTLVLNTDYTVSYSNNINVGTAKVTVSGKGNYTGSKTANFTIVKAPENPDSSITCKKTVYKVTYGAKPFKINATSKSKLTFTSSNSKIASVGKDTGKVTIKGTGVATITIKAGKDSVKVTVKVSPKKQSLKSVKVAKGKKLVVKWAKDKNATGYQVQISTTKNFKKIAKQKKLAKNTYTFTKLKVGQKYYVRVRSYKKSGKETLYGTWSKVKQSKVIR